MSRLLIEKKTYGNNGLAPRIQTDKWLAQLEYIRNFPEKKG